MIQLKDPSLAVFTARILLFCIQAPMQINGRTQLGQRGRDRIANRVGGRQKLHAVSCSRTFCPPPVQGLLALYLFPFPHCIPFFSILFCMFGFGLSSCCSNFTNCAEQSKQNGENMKLLIMMMTKIWILLVCYRTELLIKSEKLLMRQLSKYLPLY